MMLAFIAILTIDYAALSVLFEEVLLLTLIKLFHFILKNQAFYVSTNPFIDMGAIVNPFRLGAEKGTDLYREATKLHESAGLGLKLVMNRNFVVGVEAAKPFRPEDGHGRFIVGTNYIF